MLAVYQGGAVPSESGAGSGGPVVGSVLLEIAGRGHVVGVDDYLGEVGVALAGAHHIGAGVLEHRHQEGHNVALGVEVLDGLENAGALPFPAVEFRLEIPAVALPESDVGTVETLGRRLRLKVDDEFLAFGGAGKLLRGKKHQVVKVFTVGREGRGVAFVLVAEDFRNVGFERGEAG